MSATDTLASARPQELGTDPYSEDTLRDPYPFQRQLLDRGPVVLLPQYGVYAVGRHEEAKTVLADHARFTATGGVGIQDIRKPGDFRVPNRLLETDPPVHTRVRSVLNRLLSPIVIRRFRDAFEAKADAVVSDLIERRHFDGVEHCAEAFVLSAFPDAVGVRLPRTETLAIGEMRFNQSGPPNELHRRAMVNAAPYVSWFEQSCQRDSVIPESISEMLFDAEEAGDLDEGVAANMVRSFVGGGTDSTISGIGSTLNQLARHPGQWALLGGDTAKVKAAFEEGIRYESPFQVTYRVTVGEVELGGCALAADMKVGVFLGAANRDPRRWPDPDRFDITRPQLTGAHLALGTGVHACVGQMIARLEAESLLTALSRRVRTIRLTGETSYRLMNQMRTLAQLPLEIEPF